MKRLATAALIAGAVLTTSGSTAGAATVFTDNFNSGASASWGDDSGSWAASGGVYDATVPDNFPNAHSFAPNVWTDFTVSVDVNDAIDGGIWLRAANTADVIGAEGILLVFAANSLYFHDVQSGDYGGSLSSVGLAFGGDYNLKVEVSGNNYSAFVDGMLATSLIGNTSFSSGKVGLYSNFDSGGPFDQSFDNFSVSEVPIPAALPLLISALGFFGFVGWRRKKTA